ncbi:MAG TPA: hypothetical protein VF720_03235, partial [Candidatus Eisenbacteria bacterium]
MFAARAFSLVIAAMLLVAIAAPARAQRGIEAIPTEPAPVPEVDDGPSRPFPPFRSNGLPGLATTPIGSPNVRMNDPSGDGSTEVQSAPQIAAAQNRVFACWFDSRGLDAPTTTPPNTLVGFGWSTNYGQTWIDGGNMPRLTSDSQVLNARLTGDGQGNFYLVARVTTNLLGTNGTSIGLWKGTFTGSSFAWGTPTYLNSLAGTTEILDNPFVLVAPGSPVVYVAWTRIMNGLAQGRIEIIRSDDAGLNWTAPATVAQDYSGDRRPGHARLALGPSGEVYATWLAFSDFIYFQCNIDDNAQAYEPIYFSRSVDSGATWTAPVTVLNQGIMVRPIVGPGETASSEGMYPSFATDNTGGPGNGVLYVTAPHSPDFSLGATSGITRPEVEANDFPAQAASVLQPGDEASGTWTSTADNDYWPIDLTAGQTVFLHLEPPAFTCPSTNGMTVTLRLYAADIPLANVHPDTLLGTQTRTSGAPSWLMFTCQRTGRYFIRAFTGSASALNQDYRLRSRLVSFAAPTANNPARDTKDIVLCLSTDQGSTWSQPVRINTSPAGLVEGQPNVITDEKGALHIFWYDRRESVLNPGLVNQAQPTDIYLYSKNPLELPQNRRISDQSGAFAGLSRSTTYPGNFGGLWQAGGRLYAAWADGRSRSGLGGTSVDTWVNVLDFYPPQTTVVSGPAEGDTLFARSVTFVASGMDSVTAMAALTYETQMDGGGWVARGTTTSFTYNDMTPGAHTFQVRASDAAANTDATPVTVGFHVSPRITWANPAGGSWNTAANWNTNTVPGSGDEVEITLAGAYTVSLGSSATVSLLMLGGAGSTPTLDIANATLTATTGTTVASGAT